MEIKEISSFQNPLFKELISLIKKPGLRKEGGKIVIEGVREVQAAINNGIEIESLFFCGKYIDIDSFLNEYRHSFREDYYRYVYSLTEELYQKAAVRDSSEGVIAVAKKPFLDLKSVSLSDNPLVVVLESVEKPGNLGAILRTCDAVGCDLLIVCDQNTDIYNPNVIRSSLGALFYVPTVQMDSQNAIKWLMENNILIYTSQLQDSELYYDTDFTKPCAIVMGCEHKGLSDIWRLSSDKKIRIPMHGQIDSLNVSVSTAILCYEAVKQRRGNNNDGQ